jgi:prolyl oligopeptidase
MSPGVRSGALLFVIGMTVTSMTGGTAAPSEPSSDTTDKYLWLEEVRSDRALGWVSSQNQRSSKVLESDPRFVQLQAEALKVAESPDRLASPRLNGSDVYNTWQDATHVRGILRRTSLEDYLKATPDWKTVIDYDALAKQDNEKWVARRRVCLYPGDEFCLISLSAGGEDADTMREFDLKAGKFVEGGFVLPTSKQSVQWVDKDTLLVTRDWGGGTMTKSGYPFVAKLWKRGQPLNEAREIYRATENDMIVDPIVLNDAGGHQAVFVTRNISFFEKETYLVTTSGVTRVALPAKADINEMLDGQIIVTLNQDWQPKGTAEKFVQGSIVSMDFEALKKDPENLHPTVVFAPTPTEFVQEGVTATRNHLLVTTLENVQGRVWSFTRTPNGAWTRRKIAVPNSTAVSIVTANWADDQFFLSMEGFLTPESLFLGDAGTGSLHQAKALPPQFDASGKVVEQLTAISKDGTHVPYFVVRPKNISYDGNNPTLLEAYGGFQISYTPSYDASLGKLWLERGGIYVLANIRGGGEFGPAWHDAGLKTNRQRIYDDFAAVGEDLVKRKITSRQRLGIRGGSNGGLLMGVEMTQHPRMWNAILIMIPLLDMLRFEKIAAGASWVGEYGSVSNPAERAFLASISPYNQLSPDVTYPEPFIFTTTKDDRVGPVHARKFAAKMDEFHKPYLYLEIVEGGHGAGADLKQQAKTEAYMYAYLIRKLMD